MRIAESFLIPVCAEVRIEHANPTALFTRVADACKGLDDSILAEAANQVALTRKKVMSPRCLLDCVEAAKKLARVQAPQSGDEAVTITKADDPQQWAAWHRFCEKNERERKYATLLKLMSMSSQINVESEWPPTKADREAVA